MTSYPYLFHNGDVPLAGRMYRRDDDLLTSQPGIIITGSWLTVKEQMDHRYALELAQRGFTVFTFDFSGFGQSGGRPRQVENPARKIADIIEVARQVSTLSYVRGVGHLAVCASAQYALAAIAGGARISSFASVAGWYHDTATVAPFYGEAEGVAMRISRAREALEDYFRTGQVRTVPAYREGDDRAGMFLPMDYYASSARGAVPQWVNEMAELSWLYWLTFDGLSSASRVSVPTLLVHSDDCVLPDNVKTVRDRLAGFSQLVWSQGSQTDFYDQPEQVSMAVDAVEAHFRETLRP